MTVDRVGSAPGEREQRLAEIRARLATIGRFPWKLTRHMEFGAAIWSATGNCLFRVYADLDRSVMLADGRAAWQHDSDFVLHAPEDVAYLLGLASGAGTSVPSDGPWWVIRGGPNVYGFCLWEVTDDVRTFQDFETEAEALAVRDALNAVARGSVPPEGTTP